MKKLFLSTGLLCTSLIHAQDNWDSLVVSGIAADSANFSIIQKFNGKMYLGGASNPGNALMLYSSPTGDMGSYSAETGFNSLPTPVGPGVSLSASTSNGTFMFLGSATNSGCSITIPQVYKFDGASYSVHGPSDYSSLPAENAITSSSRIDALAIFNPTGNSANDSIYAFVNPGNGNNISVWKADANSASPVWVNSTNFPLSSGITKVYDAITWHKRLYICVNRNDSLDAQAAPIKVSLILSTADGVTWDTVANTNLFSYAVGMSPGPYANYHFAALEIHNDSLYAGFSDSYGPSLWVTGDSLSPAPAWKNIYNNNDQSFYDLVDLQSDGKNIWILTNSTDGYVSVTRFNRQLAAYGFLPSSVSGTDLNSYYYANSYRLQYFNNYIYTAGYLSQANNFGLTYNYGNAWRLGIPQASLSINPGNICVNTVDSLKNTSVRYTTTQWFVDGVHHSNAQDTILIPTTSGPHTVMVVSYNGSLGGICDSLKQNFFVYALPVIDTVFASSTTICQGQPDTVRAHVQPGSGPYIYGWTQSLNIIGLNDSVIPFTLTTVSTPSPSPIGFFTMDANGCQANYPYTMYITVNGGDSLSGVVNDTLLNPVSAGKVYLFKLNPLNPNPGDTAGVFTLAANGAYNFPGLYYGSYIAKAVADTADPLYATSVGTYYSNKTYAYQWDSALIIQHHACAGGNNSGNDIKILQIPAAPSGPGVITGRISESLTFGARYNGPNSVFGAPLKGVDIKLGKNPGGSPAARTTSDTSGNYSFSNVPIGQYKIYVDIPNYGMDSVREIDLTVNAVSVHNDYYVDSTMVRVVPVNGVTTAICSGDSILLQGAYQNVAGIYYDTLTAAGGYDSLIITTLSVTALPSVSVTASTLTVCSGNNVVLTASGTTSYVWSSNAGSVTTATASLNPTVSDTYTITGTSNGCSDVKTISITVNQLPNVTMSNNSPVCENQNLNLNAAGGVSYSWVGPNTFTSSVQNPILSGAVPIASGVYTVTVTDINTCINTATISAVVNPLPVVTASGATVCAGATINLNAAGGAIYSWSGPGAFTSNQQNPGIPNANTSMSGTYSVTATDANNCTNGNSAQVTVNTLPNVIANASLDTVCLGNAVTLTGSGASTYTWSGGVTDGVSFTPSVTDTYTVVGADLTNCSNAATVTVVAISCIGIQNFGGGNYAVYPNPASDKLVIETAVNAGIKLTNILGENLLEQSISSGKNEISIIHLPAGAYELMINSNGQISRQKIIISN